MENILELEYVVTSTRYFLLVYYVQNIMRNNVQIGIKSKKIDQYVVSFAKMSSNKLHTLQPSAKIYS